MGNLHSLRILDLGQNKLRSLPDGMRHLENLEELLLNNNKLSRLDSSSFLGLSKLAFLDLSFNQIEQLPDDLFCCLNSLNALLLSNNLLRTLPQSIALLSSLTLLRLSHNQLISLPESFGNLFNLTELALDSNKLSYLPESLAGAENLEYLDLHSNAISELPAKLGRLSKLAILNLRNNLLVSLPSELGQLVSLRVLDLSDNQICSLPPSIANLRLSALWLASNQARPLVPLTVSWGEEGLRLTCFLLPQINTIGRAGVLKPDKVSGFSRQVSFCCKESSKDGKEEAGEEKCTARSAEVLPKVKTKSRRSMCNLPRLPVPAMEQSDIFQDKPINSAVPHQRSMPHSPILKMVQSRVSRLFQSHNYKGLSSSTDSL